MRFVLVDGGPGGKGDVNGDLIRRFLPSIHGHEYGVLNVRDEDHSRDAAILNSADGVVLFSPVYNGGVSDRMLAFLAGLSGKALKKLPAAVYLHTDLYEAESCRQAMFFMEEWCLGVGWMVKSSAAFGGDRILLWAEEGGAGEVAARKYDHVLDSCTEAFASSRRPAVYMNPPLPRFLYRQIAEREEKNHYEKNK